MSKYKQYIRIGIAEMRPVEVHEAAMGLNLEENISVSEEDKINGSPKLGDMIARNPNNTKDKWLVSKEYFTNNFKLKDK